MRDLQATAEALLADMVGFPSVTGTPNGAIVGYIKDYLENLNIPVRIDAHEDGERFNLFATIGPQIDGGIVLSGHTDWCRQTALAGPLIPSRCVNRTVGYMGAARSI